MRKEVLSTILPFLKEKYGNPSSLHSHGLQAREAIENARKKIAEILSCKAEEIIFTSGGTESINLAIKGVALANKEKGNHIITSKVEHPAVLDTCKYLEAHGCKVTYLPVDNYGTINLRDLESAITDKTILISIIYANNEIGTIQPIKEIGKIAKAHGILFHTDACQAAGSLNLNIQSLGVDLMTLNGSKVYGPKGSGILYKKHSIKLVPLIHGGGQEFGLRSGTENVPAIVGFAKALELAQSEKDREVSRLTKLRDFLISQLLKIPNTHLNGHPTDRLPNNVNVRFDNIEGEGILLHLNERGIFVSTGSACASKSLEPSHVLLALGISHEKAHGSIRFSLGKYTKMSDIKYLLRVLPPIITKLRSLSPLNEKC